MLSYWPLMLLLAAIWGASYLFIKVAVEDIEPAPMMAFRTLLAGAVLTGYLAATTGGRRAARDLRASWRPALVLGAFNAAIPFWLVAWGEKHIDSSVAGISACCASSRAAVSPWSGAYDKRPPSRASMKRTVRSQSPHTPS